MYYFLWMSYIIRQNVILDLFQYKLICWNIYCRKIYENMYVFSLQKLAEEYKNQLYPINHNFFKMAHLRIIHKMHTENRGTH